MDCTHDPPFFSTFSSPEQDCVECLVQTRIAAIEKVQDQFRKHGGVFKAAEKAHRDGRKSCAMAFRCGVRRRWVVTKLQLLAAVTDVEMVMEMGSQREVKKCRRALEMYEEAKERLAELPGMGDGSEVEGSDQETVDEAMSQVGVEDCVEDPSDDGNGTLEDDEEEDEEDAPSTAEATPEKITTAEPTASPPANNENTGPFLEHAITKFTLSTKSSSTQPPNKLNRTVHFAPLCLIYPYHIADIVNPISNTGPRSRPHNTHTDAERHRWRVQQCLYFRMSGTRKYWFYKPGVWASPKGYTKVDTSMRNMRWADVVAMETKENPEFRLKVKCERDCECECGNVIENEDEDEVKNRDEEEKGRNGRGLMGLMGWRRGSEGSRLIRV